MRLFSRGFTLNEILVVCAIVGLFSSVVIFSVSEAREKARDKARVVMVEELSLAMRLYVKQYGNGVDCDSGVKISGTTNNAGNRLVMSNGTPGSGSCGDAANILNFLEKHFGDVPSDPLGVDHAEYYYYFDAAHDCETGQQRPMVFAVRMENMESNVLDVCDIDSGNDGGYTSGNPYVKRVDFIDPA